MLVNLHYIFIIFLFTYFVKPPAIVVKDTENDGIVWRKNQKLNWDDFQSKIDTQESLHAMTTTNIDVKAQCYGNLVKYEVKSIFVKKYSWAKNKIIG